MSPSWGQFSYFLGGWDFQAGVLVFLFFLSSFSLYGNMES